MKISVTCIINTIYTPCARSAEVDVWVMGGSLGLSLRMYLVAGGSNHMRIATWECTVDRQLTAELLEKFSVDACGVFRKQHCRRMAVIIQAGAVAECSIHCQLVVTKKSFLFSSFLTTHQRCKAISAVCRNTLDLVVACVTSAV